MGGFGIGLGIANAFLSGGGGGCTPFSQVDGIVAVNTTFTHPADGVIAWTQTGTPTNTFEETRVEFRRQDASNYWYGQVSRQTTACNLVLFEVIAGGVNNRASVINAVNPGDRVAVVLNGATITGYLNGVLKWTYVSSGNFATATSGKLSVLQTGSVVNNLKTWSLACRASEGV